MKTNTLRFTVDCSNCNNAHDKDLLKCPICDVDNDQRERLPSLLEAHANNDQEAIDWITSKMESGQPTRII